MLKLILFLAFQASARLVKFRFPDPANETAPFCDLLPLIKSNAFIRCTNSSFHGSSCAFRCQGEDRLLNQYGIEANKYSTCFCDEKDSCTWRGDASDAKCQDAGKLREEIVSSVNRGFVKTYLKEELTPIMLKVSKSTGGNIRRVIKKSKKLRKQVLKQIPTSDNGLAEFFGQKDKLQMIQDVPIDVEELERNIKADSSGGCKPLTLSFGSVECSNGFAENSECKNVCKEGYVLHRKSPGKRVCICTKWGCTWLKKTPARCQRRTKRGRNKDNG